LIIAEKTNCRVLGEKISKNKQGGLKDGERMIMKEK
jgi:hypothetical protein